MKTRCPHCGQHYEVDDAYAGEVLECPDCKQSFSAIQSREEPVQTQPNPKSRIKTECPCCGQLYEIDAAFDGKLVECVKCKKNFPVIQLISSDFLTPIENPKNKKDRRPALALATILRWYCLLIGGFGVIVPILGCFVLAYHLREDTTEATRALLAAALIAIVGWPFLLIPFFRITLPIFPVLFHHGNSKQ